jgi:hypothetical protein
MNIENMNLLIEALDSGEYTQNRYAYHEWNNSQGDSYCVIGLAKKISGLPDPHLHVAEDWLGLKDRITLVGEIFEWNRSQTFPEIAQRLRSEVDKERHKEC